MEIPGLHEHELAALLEAGASLDAVSATGGEVSLLVREVFPSAVRAQIRRGEVGVGDVLTARIAPAGGVVFVQLVAESIEGDGAVLRTAGAVTVANERWMERSRYDGRARVRTEDGAVLDARVRDVSPLGIRLVVGSALPVGALLDIVLEDGGAGIELRARVVRARVSGEEHEVAGEIVALAPAQWAALERLLG
jgi:hypothetical protein